MTHSLCMMAANTKYLNTANQSPCYYADIMILLPLAQLQLDPRMVYLPPVWPPFGSNSVLRSSCRLLAQAHLRLTSLQSRDLPLMLRLPMDSHGSLSSYGYKKPFNPRIKGWQLHTRKREKSGEEVVVSRLLSKMRETDWQNMAI